MSFFVILTGGGRFNRRFQGGKPQRKIPNAHVPSELKDVEQVRKERQRKASNRHHHDRTRKVLESL